MHVHLPGTLTPLLHIEGGQLYTVITDHLGAPRELVDTAGRIAWTAHFSAWGILLEQTRAPNTPDVSSPFRLLGQYHDPETNLCHTRFRHFDPETARWLTPDPLGFDGGRNLLAFDGSPIQHVDPWGLCKGDGKATTTLFHGHREPLAGGKFDLEQSIRQKRAGTPVPGVYLTDDPVRAATQYATPSGYVTKVEVPTEFAESIKQESPIKGPRGVPQHEYLVTTPDEVDTLNKNPETKSSMDALRDWIKPGNTT